jgi:hypothetical protein
MIPDQHLDLSATDAELIELRQSVPIQYAPDMKRWKRDKSKDFYLGMLAGMNACIRVDMGKMTKEDKRDYIKKLAIDAGLIAGGFGKIIGG